MTPSPSPSPAPEATPTIEPPATLVRTDEAPPAPRRDVPPTPTPRPHQNPPLASPNDSEPPAPPPLIDPANDYRSSISRAIPTIGAISLDPATIGTNLFLSMLLLLLLAAGASIFNTTVKENSAEIAGALSSIAGPFVSLYREAPRRVPVSFTAHPGMAAAARPLLILGTTALVYGFLDPSFGFNRRGLVIVLSVTAGIGLVTYVYDGAQSVLASRRFGLPAAVQVYPVAILIAGAAVVFSRSVGLQPGVMYGFVASVAITSAAAVNDRHLGQLVYFANWTLLAVSIGAWLLVGPLRDLSDGSDAWWAAVPEGIAVALFVGGLQGMFFNLIPVTFTDGAQVWRWSKAAWFSIALVVTFLFWHVVLNEEDAYGDALRRTSAAALLLAASVFLTLTFALWSYFLYRARKRAAGTRPG